MDQNFITVENVRIAYIEKNLSSDKTIFFIHGNSSSHRTWLQQFNSPLFDDYRLIAFDLPAHGSSDSARDITDGYSLPGIAKLMAKAVLELTKGKSYVLTGVSLGTNVLAEMLPFNIKPAGLILVSPCIVSRISDLQRVFVPNASTETFFQDIADIQKVKASFDNYFFHDDEKILRSAIEDFVAVKAPFRSHLLQNAFKLNDEIDILKKAGIALLIVFGASDKTIYINYLNDSGIPLWKNNFFILKDACHSVHNDQAKMFNQLLADYSAECFRSSHS